MESLHQRHWGRSVGDPVLELDVELVDVVDVVDVVDIVDIVDVGDVVDVVDVDKLQVAERVEVLLAVEDVEVVWPQNQKKSGSGNMF